MMTKGFRGLLAVAFALCSLFSSGCSKGADPPKEAKEVKPITQQTKEAIQGYAKKPIDKARATHDMGDERNAAVDQAVKGTANQ